MRLSVVICTRNRANQLRHVLRSISQCTKPPEGEWELIVIDNGSTDDTRQVLDEALHQLPLRVYTQPQPGLSHARNLGAEQALGEWLLWTDDDVRVSARWLAEYHQAILTHADAQVFGGPIEIHFEGTPPTWLAHGAHVVRSAYAGLDADDLPGELRADGPVPYGANFAVRKALVEANRFDTDLGRHPEHPMRAGEETPMIRRALRQGPGYWLREACVQHHIDAPRQTRRYLRAYYYSYGRRQAGELAQRVSWRGLATETGKSLRDAVRAELRLLRARNGHDAPALLKTAGRSWGRVAEGLRCLGGATTARHNRSNT